MIALKTLAQLIYMMTVYEILRIYFVIISSSIPTYLSYRLIIPQRYKKILKYIRIEVLGMITVIFSIKLNEKKKN